MWIFILLLMVSTVNADTKIYYDKNTKEVHFIAEDKDEVVLSAEDKVRMEVAIVKHYPELDRSLNYYKFNGKDVVLNSKKISDENTAKEKAEDKKNRDRQSAIDKLKALGLTDDEVGALR